MRRIPGRIALVVGVVLSLAGVAAAESFGPRPVESQSRCAALVVLRGPSIMNIGQEITLRAGPITASCGGPPSKTHYNWQTDDPSQPSDAPGLVMVHRCAEDAPTCVYRARLFTLPGFWQALSITGSSPFGGWSSDVTYAIRYGSYFGVGIGVDPAIGQPKAVTLSGGRRHESTTATQSGLFEFAIKRGTYTFSFRVGHRAVKRRIRLSDRPGKSIQVTIGPNYTRIG